MRVAISVLVILLSFSCSNKTEKAVGTVQVKWDEAKQLEINAKHESPRMQYKLVQSKFTTKEDVWKYAQRDMGDFSEKDYHRLKPLIYEQDIPTIQNHVKSRKLTYENLVKWYIYRIVKYESNPETSLHSIICLNQNAIRMARYKDANKGDNDHPIYGMPVLLKDNINTSGCATTAGAIVLANNQTKDATIVTNLKRNGAIILGKVNLSEWAYYFCDGCPLGYSAVGGQTLNPYGRFIFETGGSSAGSGVVMAANYAAAAVGTETAGSIISPSSQNSLVGLKPTIGVLSRTGIVPISSTLDTPGPMTRTVVDNAILLSAMSGNDRKDRVTMLAPQGIDFISELDYRDMTSLRLGANAVFMQRDSMYRSTVQKLKNAGATIIEYTPAEISLNGFVDILNYDMQRDLPLYFKNETGDAIGEMSVGDVIEYNTMDSLLRAPYGQGRFIATRDDRTPDAVMDSIKNKLEEISRAQFQVHVKEYNLDAILSINNYESAIAALAKFPCLAMPMGYSDKGEPRALTFIGKRFKEKELLQVGRAYEKAFDIRKPPSAY
ncbi:MAG: amidase family protein [Bacteroidota bacterium]